MTRNLKNCDGKAPLDLLPARPLRAIASAFHDGAAIYEPWDWAEKTDGCREMYVAAALRHLLAYADPDDSDYAEDSGVHHLAAAGANIMILLHHDEIDYHVAKSVRDTELGPPFYVTAGCECHSAGCPKCRPEPPERVRCPVYDSVGAQCVHDDLHTNQHAFVMANDVRAQCFALHPHDGMRCLKDDEHEGQHENDRAIWNDSTCEQGCP